jgi:hypothetical protein
MTCETLIWASMICGYNSITEKNWKDVYLRVHAYEKVAGTFITKVGKKKRTNVWITPKDVYDWIGLTTNASTLSVTAFKNRLWNRAIEYVPDNIRAFEKELAKESNEVSSDNVKG